MPGVVLCLVVGLLADHPAAGMVAASGAVSAGFGVFHRITRYRLVPSIAVAIGMAVSAWIGTVVGHRDMFASLATMFCWGVAFGVATVSGSEHWWLGLQFVVALCISAAYPATPHLATDRVALLMAGGLIEAAVIASIWLVTRERFTQMPRPVEAIPLTIKQTVSGAIELLDTRSAGGRYIWRLTAMLTFAVFLSHELYDPVRFRSSYWIPMTAAIVVKPQFRSTVSRSFARTCGTIVGAVLATKLVTLLHPRTPTLAVLVVIFVWCCFALVQVNYGLFAVCVTAYVVCLLAMAGLPPPQVAWQRAEATLIGGGLATIVHVTSLRFWRVQRPNRMPIPSPA